MEWGEGGALMNMKSVLKGISKNVPYAERRGSVERGAVV